MGNIISTNKLFSKRSNTKAYVDLLKMGSGFNDAVASHRRDVYGRMFSFYDTLKKEAKTFSDYSESDLLGNQYFNATLMGLAKSMAGYLSIERDMDQPKALLWFLDLLNVANQAEVLPNLGPENIGSYANLLNFSSAAQTGANQAYDVLFTKTVLPGTVKATIVIGGVTYNVTDDKNGNLIAIPGVLGGGLGANIVNYASGMIQFTIALTANAATDTVAVVAIDNQTGEQSQNRFETDWKSILVETFPEMLTVEVNLVAMAAQRKAIGVEAQDVGVSKLTELYTKMVNIKLVSAIVNQDLGNPTIINMTPGQYLDYRSELDKFSSQLVDVDTALALKSYKGTKATAYLCGTTVVSIFRKLKNYGQFVDAPQGYINDLVGYFNGIPVLEHTNLPATTGYAVHKTPDGQLAPAIRGIFLPLTNTPAIGNYQNVTQTATGVFYQEKNIGITPLLQQQFQVTGYSS